MSKHDILIIGSGFAGTLTALCLHQKGFNVCIVEKGSHPRFAIGESSTPVADMILRNLADRYELLWLRNLSRYGSWQEHYPGIICGIKRGFSYYKHESGKPFTTDPHHKNELLVAASTDNHNSDTHWFRADLDHFLIKKAQEAGISYFDQTIINQLGKNQAGNWNVSASRHNKPLNIYARFIVDATGSSLFSEKFLSAESSSKQFETNTQALYSHFTGVSHWLDYLKKENFKTDDYPFNPDHSALHHIVDEGWFWMLRFNNELLSAGVVIDKYSCSDTGENPETEWNRVLAKYPSIEKLFSHSKTETQPGKIIESGRLQRCLNKITGDGWAALHHTGGFVDPLHSTGIAHSLCGVEKLTAILSETWEKPSEMTSELKNYEEEFFSELQLIDLLVSGCYKSKHHFDLFTAFTMLYFICTVTYEQNRLAGETQGQFLCADNKKLRSLAFRSYDELKVLLQYGAKNNDRKWFIHELRQNIMPFNRVGLMKPEKQNMYKHTAVVL